MPLPETPGHLRTSLGQSLLGSQLLSPGSWCTQVSICALQESISPVPCKSLRLYCGVNGDLLQEGLCHAHVCCTQSPCPCSSPLLTRTSTGHAQTQFYLSLCGVPGFWCEQHLFEPSERLWREWGLILNVNSPLLPPCFLDEGYLLGCSNTAPLAAHYIYYCGQESLRNGVAIIVNKRV